MKGAGRSKDIHEKREKMSVKINVETLHLVVSSFGPVCCSLPVDVDNMNNFATLLQKLCKCGKADWR